MEPRLHKNFFTVEKKYLDYSNVRNINKEMVRVYNRFLEDRIQNLTRLPKI